MPEPLLQRVKSRLFIQSRRPVVHLLDGQYRSITQGRSFDFDDLRDYQAGDEVRDIDWNATARMNTTLVRRFRAERRARVLFLTDLGRNMSARAANGATKVELAIAAIGVIGFLAIRHGDEVGLIAGDRDNWIRLPFRTREKDLERLLQRIHSAVSAEAGLSDLPGMLERARTMLSQRSMVVVVADEFSWIDGVEASVRQLAARHDVVWIEIADADPVPTNPRERSFDVSGSWRMPELLRGDAKLRAEYEWTTEHMRAAREHVLVSSGASYIRIGDEADVVAALLRGLKVRSRVRR